MTGFTVDTGALRNHAAKLGQIKGDVVDAVDAGSEMQLDSYAFGVACSFLAPPAMVSQAACTSGIAELGTMLAGAQAAISTFAAGYDFVDVTLRGALNTLYNELAGD